MRVRPPGLCAPGIGVRGCVRSWARVCMPAWVPGLRFRVRASDGARGWVVLCDCVGLGETDLFLRPLLLLKNRSSLSLSFSLSLSLSHSLSLSPSLSLSFAFYIYGQFSLCLSSRPLTRYLWGLQPCRRACRGTVVSGLPPQGKHHGSWGLGDLYASLI